MLRFERFNYTASLLNPRDEERLLARSLDAIARRQFPNEGRFPHLTYANAIRTAFELLTLAHLEVPLTRFSPRQLLVQLVGLTTEYFFGDWRQGLPVFSGEPTPPERVRNESWWVDEFRYGLLAALILEDGAATEKFATYLDFDLPLFDVPSCPTEASQLWLVWLAAFVRGAPPADIEAAGARVLAARSADRIDAAVRALEALVARDGVRFRGALLDHMKSFRSRESNPSASVGELVSVEGSILWHLGRRDGMTLPDLRSHAVRKPKFKVKRPGVKVPELETSLLDYVLFPDAVSHGQVLG